MIVCPFSEAHREDAAAIQLESPEAAQWPVDDPCVEVALSALIDGELAGFVLARRLASDESEILNLAVKSVHRQHGVGRALVEHLKGLLPGEIFLEVRASNLRAIAFYRNLGFQHVGTRKSYYANTGEDAIVLRFQPC